MTPRYTPAAGGTSRTADRAYAATATSFFPPGPEKGLRIPFTKLPLTDPVTYFFDALSRADALYPFIGLCQVLAAVLIAIPRAATLGALVHLPTIPGIVVITTTMHFALTPGHHLPDAGEERGRLIRLLRAHCVAGSRSSPLSVHGFAGLAGAELTAAHVHRAGAGGTASPHSRFRSTGRRECLPAGGTIRPAGDSVSVMGRSRTADSPREAVQQRRSAQPVVA